MGELLTTLSPKYKMGNEQSIAFCMIFNYNDQNWERFQKHFGGVGDEFVNEGFLSPFCIFIYMSIVFL